MAREKRRGTMSTDPIVHPTTGYELAPDQLLFTTTEAANILRLGKTTVYMLMRSGDITPVYIGRSCRISRGELERYVAKISDSRTLEAGSSGQNMTA
jgi:excisionase family DNA binding protein